jgi:hypothetical protein
LLQVLFFIFASVQLQGQYRIEDKIEYYPMNAEGKVRARDRIISMDEDSNGNLWMGTIGEMLKFDPGTARFQRI